jgi:hypothetical protein
MSRATCGVPRESGRRTGAKARRSRVLLAGVGRVGRARGEATRATMHHSTGLMRASKAGDPLLFTASSPIPELETQHQDDPCDEPHHEGSWSRYSKHRHFGPTTRRAARPSVRVASSLALLGGRALYADALVRVPRPDHRGFGFSTRPTRKQRVLSHVCRVQATGEVGSVESSGARTVVRLTGVFAR